jgi:hypothetical protein
MRLETSLAFTAAAVLSALLGVVPAAADVTSYRALNGKTKNDARSPDGKCWNGAQTSPSQFRIDDDGLSTFEDSSNFDSTRPYRVGFVISGVAHCDAHTTGSGGAVQSMHGYLGTCTPAFGDGHWSLDNEGVSENQKKQDFSDYSQDRAQRNPRYAGNRPYCEDLGGARRGPPARATGR